MKWNEINEMSWRNGGIKFVLGEKRETPTKTYSDSVSSIKKPTWSDRDANSRPQRAKFVGGYIILWNYVWIKCKLKKVWIFIVGGERINACATLNYSRPRTLKMFHPLHYHIIGSCWYNMDIISKSSKHNYYKIPFAWMFACTVDHQHKNKFRQYDYLI